MFRNTITALFRQKIAGIGQRAVCDNGMRGKLTLASLAVALLLPAATVGAQTATDAGVDTSIKPGDDFFAYANGDWLKNTQIPAGKQRWTVGNEITELTRQQIAKLLDDAATEPKDSTARKVADFRKAFLNEAAIEAKGIAPIKSLLDQIDRVRDKAALARLLGGSESDEVRGVAFDNSGNLVVAGATLSYNFPTRNPLQAANGGFSDFQLTTDSFAARLNPTTFELLSSTYLGGLSNDHGS